MTDLERSRDLRNRLKQKMGFTQEEEKQRIEIPNYEEAKANNDTHSMLMSKLYGSKFVYANAREEVNQMGINTLKANKKALENRIHALKEEEEKEIANIENEIALELERKLQDCKNDLTRNITISNYLKFAEEKKEEIINKFCKLDREYSLQLKAYEDKEQEFLEENKEILERIKKEKLEKEIREMVALEEIEKVNNNINFNIQEEEEQEEEI